jgi:hypothetical protein
MTSIENIPLSAALADVYSLIDEGSVSEINILEWASHAFRKLKVKQLYESTTKFIKVTNHVAKLPTGIKYIEQIFYKADIVEADVTQISVYTSSTPDFEITENNINFLNSPYYTTNWNPLRLASSVFHNQIVIKDSPNYRARCEEEYSINKNNCVITSFDSGYIAVSYMRFPMADGEFLIPDDIKILDAIKNYVLMKIWEKRYNFKEDGAEGRYQNYRRMWEITRASTIGSIMLFSIDEYENYKQQTLRIGSHTNTYYQGFGNLAEGENDIHFR